MQAEMGAVQEEVDDSSEFARVEFERRALLTLPVGWKLAQLKAEHPNGTYAEAKREIVNEIARCWDMPYNIAAGNSSGYNYASGRLDHQSWVKAVRVRRSRVASVILDRLFNAWKREAILIEGYLPQTMRSIVTNWSHQWFFEGWEHVDPVKEATAAQIRLQAGIDTLSDIWGERGSDWEDKLEQIARERARMRELGISVEEVAATPDPEDDEAMSACAIVRDEAGRISGVRRWRA
jgi:capsid protein